MPRGDSVILVEPFPAERELIETVLTAEGIEVLSADCLLEAVLQQAVTQGRVILYDADAPEHWRTALEQFLRMQPVAHVIVLSRLADDHMWIEVLDTGGYDLLMKPLRGEEIRGVVHNALRRLSAAAA